MLNEIVFLAFSTILSVNAQGGGGNITACGNPSQACGQQSYFPANSERN